MNGQRPLLTAIWSLLAAALVACGAAGAEAQIASAQALRAAPTATPAPAAPPSQPLKLLSLNADSYPALKARVTVWQTQLGLPVQNLGAADFGATVDGQAAQITQARPLGTAAELPLQIVLLIDTSLPEDTALAKIKIAASNFVETLGTSDQAALMTVADTAVPVLPFTSDREQLKAAIANLSRVVARTSLHQGLVEAARLFSPSPTTGANRLILTITNTGDNPGLVVPAAEVIRQAQAASAAIQVVNYTGVDTGKSLALLARQTGGHYYLLTSADQLDNALQALATVVRQGYEITFISPLPADNAEHTATLTLSTPDLTAEVQGRLKAPPPAEFKINGPGVTAGQTVFGVVQLDTDPRVPMPPVASVEYQLDGQTFATLTTPPYKFQWDSTSVNPGRHQLKVVVHDSAGNSGEAEVTIQVTLPFAVTASSERAQVSIGDKVVIRAQVNSPARIDHVEFLQADGVLLASLDAAPYECVLDTKNQTPGRKSYRVRAVDYLGRTAETDLFYIEFRSTAASVVPTIIHWGLLALNAIAIVVALLGALFGGLALSARLKRRLQSAFKLEIVNEGNTRNRYALRAEEALDALSFEFRLDGAALPVQTVLAISPAVMTEAALEPETPLAASPDTPAAGPSVADVKQTGAYQSYAKVSGIGAAIGSFLTTIASLLPASMAAPLRNTATNLRQGESLAYQVDRADARVKSVQHATADTAAATSLAPQGSAAPANPAARPAPKAAPASRAAPAKSETWALTPFVEAGGRLGLHLCAKPLKSTRTQVYGVRVISRLVDVTEVAPETEAGNLTVRGLNLLQRLLPMALAVTLLAVAVGLTVLLIRIWGI